MTASNASLFGSTAARALSAQSIAQKGQAGQSDSAYLLAAAAVATAGLAATASGGVAHCEREGAVRDPKTSYGISAENAVKMELKKRLTGQQEEKAPLAKEVKVVLEPVEDVPAKPPPTTPRQVETPAVINATSPNADGTDSTDPNAEPTTSMTPEEARLEAAPLS